MVLKDDENVQVFENHSGRHIKIETEIVGDGSARK